MSVEGSDGHRVGDGDLALIRELQHGFPLVERPFQVIGERLGQSEETVLAGIRALISRGVIHRLGLVVRHQELGYRANAMVVWEVPEEQVAAMGQRMRGFSFVTLCYRRRPHPPKWPYNLYCMIHGRRREVVMAQVAELTEACGLTGVPQQVLFSLHRFKQRGACYGGRVPEEEERSAGSS